MTPREIIAEAWAITTREPSLRRWSFTSSLLETLLNIKLFSYQAYFAYQYFVLHHEAGLFDDVEWLYAHTSLLATVLIVTSFLSLIVIEFFVPHICLGAIIGLAAKSHNKDKAEGGLVLGLFNFFPIFGIHEFLFLSSATTLVTASSLILRYIDGPIKFACIFGVFVLFCITNALKFFFSFAEEAVVIQKFGVFGAIAKSFKLIVSHLKRVMFLLLLLLVISIRVVLNAAMVVIIPGIVIGFAFLLTFFLSKTVSYIAAGVLGVALTIIASYFFAYLHAFKVTVWTVMYIELMKKKDLDLIEIGEI